MKLSLLQVDSYSPCWVRVLGLAHSILDHSVFVLRFLDPCLRAPSQGEPGFRGGPCPRFVCGSVEAILYGPVRRPKFNPQKRRPNSDRCLRDSLLKCHAQTAKANATYQNWFHELKPIGNEKHHLYDFHFSLRQSNQERICCRSTVEVLWNVAGNYKFRGAQIWAGKGCRHVSRCCQLNNWAKAHNKTTWRQHVMTEHAKNPQTKGPHFQAWSSTSHAEDTAPSWKQLFLLSASGPDFRQCNKGKTPVHWKNEGSKWATF